MMDRQLYFQTDYPVLQNRMYANREAARNCVKGTIRLVEDAKTGIVHNAAFIPDLMAYGSDYQNEQGLSAAFLEHLKHVRDIVLNVIGKQALVEIGCGKAFFLEMLQEQNADIRGYDSTYEGSNRSVQKSYVTSNSQLGARGLILRHVLEHVKDPPAFLAELSAANGHQGLIYIEVPCFDWICENRAWFDIYYEHVNYFRSSDFQRMFGTIIEQGHLFGGQYHYVIADLATIRRPTRDSSDPVAFPDDFTASITRLSRDAKIGQPRVIWGGASKGVIFALLAERAGSPVNRVIDINPAKQGAFLAGTGLRVLSPEEGLAGLAKDTPIYIMNPNYLCEIRDQTNCQFEYIGVGND